MKIADLSNFAPKNIDLSNEVQGLTDETSEVLKSTEPLTYAEDKLEQANTSALDTYVSPGILGANAEPLPVAENEVAIDFLSDTINQAMDKLNFQQNPPTPQMDTEVPDLKLPTESETETRRLFDGAKDSLVKRLSRYAETPEFFDDYLRQVYGDNYNKEAAESIRQKLLAGDESWLPKLEFVSEESLQGHRLAVDPSSKKIYFYGGAFYKESTPRDESNEAPSTDFPQLPTWMTGTPEDSANIFYEFGLWSSLRNEVDPQDANYVEGRNFGTMYVDEKPTIVEWLEGPTSAWGSNDPPKIS
jgi:hypothetical protein